MKLSKSPLCLAGAIVLFADCIFAALPAGVKAVDFEAACWSILDGEPKNNPPQSLDEFAVGRAYESAIELAHGAYNKLTPFNMVPGNYRNVFNLAIGKETSPTKPQGVFGKVWRDIEQRDIDHPIRIWCSANHFNFQQLVSQEGKMFVKDHRRGSQLNEYAPDDPKDLLNACFNPQDPKNRVQAFYLKPGEGSEQAYHDIQICPWVLALLKTDKEYESVNKITNWQAMNQYKRENPDGGGLSGREKTAIDASVLLDAVLLHELTHVFGVLDNFSGPNTKAYKWLPVTDLADASDRELKDGTSQQDDTDLSWNSADSLMYLALGFLGVSKGIVVQSEGDFEKV